MTTRHLFALTIIFIATKHILTTNYDDAIIFEEKGSIYFHSEQHSLSYSLDTTNYIKNTKFLEDSISNIQNICDSNKNRFITKCQQFLKIIKYTTKNVERDINLMKTRSKRGYWKSIFKIGTPIIASAGIAAAVSYTQAYNIDKKFMLLSNREQNIDKLQSKVTERSLNLFKNMMTEMYEEIQTLEKAQNKILQELETSNVINNYIDSAILAIIEHNRASQQWNDIISGNTKKQFFNFISPEKFLIDLKEIQKNIDLFLPINIERDHLINILDISSIELKNQNDTINIAIKIPLLINEQMSLIEYFSVPFKINNSKMVLLDSKSGFFATSTKNKNLKYINDKLFDTCSQINNITICQNESPILKSPINMCVFSLFFNKSFSDDCSFKSVPFDNYFIQTSKNHIYCTLKKPISVSISCGNIINNSIYLESSKQISINDACLLSNAENNLKIAPKKNKTTFVKINSKQMKYNISIELKDEMNHTTKPSILDRHKLKILQISDEFQALNEKIDNKHKNINNLGEGLNFFKWFGNIYNLFGFYGTIFFISILLLIILIIFSLVCRK